MDFSPKLIHAKYFGIWCLWKKKITQNTFSKCGLRVFKLVQINLTSIYNPHISILDCGYVYRRIFLIRSPTDNPMSELNHAKIAWSHCSRNFIHEKIFPLMVNSGQFLTLSLPSDIFMHFFLTFLCFFWHFYVYPFSD